MPLLAYFVGVGAILVGLLFVAEAQLGPAKPLTLTTNFYGLPAPYKAASTPVLTVRDAPAPEIPQTAMAAARPGDQAPLKIHVTKMPTPKKKVARAPTKPKPNLFAATGAGSGNTHRVW
jgi:hypothetical protein